MYKYLILENGVPTAIVWLLVLCLVFVIARNIYNASKKNHYRKNNNELKAHIVSNEKAVTGYSKQLRDIEKLKKEIQTKQEEIVSLQKELKNKEHDIKTLGQEINHQKLAFEKYANYKTIEANNTRLGAHFIKNVISQIYEDLERAKSQYKSIFGIHYKIGKTNSGIPPIKALKNIFKLLDYNVSALHKTNISLKEELEYINMFLDLIRYLKPKAKIELNDFLSEDSRETIQIKPTLFFPFVENALKHGSLNTEDSFISITLKETENQILNYCLVNSTESLYNDLIQETTEKSLDGFGLNALEQLVNTYYPGSSLKHKSLPNEQYLSELTLTFVG